MKARLHPTPAMQKAIDAYAEAKIQNIQCRAQEAVMKERNDIATRATYLCLLACYQVGLSPRTLKRLGFAPRQIPTILTKPMDNDSRKTIHKIQCSNLNVQSNHCSGYCS